MVYAAAGPQVGPILSGKGVVALLLLGLKFSHHKARPQGVSIVLVIVLVAN